MKPMQPASIVNSWSLARRGPQIRWMIPKAAGAIDTKNGTVFAATENLPG